MSDPRLGDMDPATFRAAGRHVLEWTADYLQHAERHHVLSRVEPGWIRSSLPATAPEQGESMDAILADFERILLPGVTHWNHPGFLAYFASSGSGPGVLAEFLTAALNQQAMLWQTSPAATELEEVVLGWLRRMLGLPEAFEGVIYDGGSASNLHGVAAALAQAVPDAAAHGLAGRKDARPLCVYASEQAHSSIKINAEPYIVDRSPAMLAAFAAARAEFYAATDWALDISEAEFTACEIDGLPAHLIRRDRDTQAIVRRATLAGTAWQNTIPAWNEHWSDTIELALEDDSEYDIVLVAPRAAPKRTFRKLVDGIQNLRDLGIAEPD